MVWLPLNTKRLYQGRAFPQARFGLRPSALCPISLPMTNLRSWGSVVCLSSVLVWAPPLMAQQPESEPPAPAVAQPPAAPPAVAAPGQAPPNSVAAPVAPAVGNAVPAPAEPTLINLQHDPAPPPPVPRTDRVHDGFYARLNLGFGNLGVIADSPGTSTAPDADGDTMSLDLAVGYAPSPGIALGGALLLESLPSASFSGETKTKASVTTLLVGPFFDGYPRARGGLHLGGAVGLAQDQLSQLDVAGFKRANGYGIAGWIGYDIWVADQWSVGGLVRLMGTRTSADAEATENSTAGSATLSTRSIQLMLTALYN